jgi:phosphatidylserine/phosphatidylglycerophosphate/cardiolipin synthase-like enzyme
LFDLTYANEDGARVVEQQIFDAIFDTIERADRFLVLDFFLYNDFAGDPTTAHRALSGELTERLVALKSARPQLPILLITDPINTVYGSEFHRGYLELRRYGVDVIETDLDVLHDSNPGYSTVYRWFFRRLHNRRGAGWLPNPFLPGDTVTLRSYLSLFNFKANHRKVVIAGRQNQPPITVVTSANPHDASSAHSNVALRFEGAASQELLASELAIARFSGWREALPQTTQAPQEEQLTRRPESPDRLQLRALTEGPIGDALLEAIAGTIEGDSIDLAMFYLSHRKISEAMIRAARRGVSVRLILDPNRDAFGREKNGIPNRPLARELTERGCGRIEVRWYQTHGEQFHTKLCLVRRGETLNLCLGSANLTRRNLDDLNLEANIELRCSISCPLALRASDYFERLWSNRDALFTCDYHQFEDRSRLRYLHYRWSEASGLSTF